MSAIATMTPKNTLASTFADKFQIDPANVMSIVANTIFKQSNNEPPLTADEINAAMIVCNQYDLNPFLKEIYAFRSKGKLLIYVSVDGWCKIINRQQELDGIEFQEHFSPDGGKITAVTCRIFRKDRRLPTVVTEYWAECKRDTDPWRTSPVRMTRHRALIQCSRVAFSISGVMDEDEADSMLGATNGPVIEGARASLPAGATVSTVTAVKAEDKPVVITEDEAKEFGKSWKASGYTITDAKAWLLEAVKVRSSLDIPKSEYAKAMAWAKTPKAQPEQKAEPQQGEPNPDEKIARELMGILQMNDEAQKAAIDEAKGDWAALVKTLQARLPE